MCHAYGILELHSHFVYHRLKPVAMMFSHGYAAWVIHRNKSEFKIIFRMYSFP